MNERQRSFLGLRHVSVLICVIGVLVAVVELTRRGRLPDTAAPRAHGGARQPFPRELTDASGERLLLPAPPQRIVSQTLATDEILLAICQDERIVALSSLAEDENFSNVVREARRIPGRTTEGAEEILRLKPDLIFVASYNRAETVKMLQVSKAPVFRFGSFQSIADIQTNIRMVGYAVGRDAEAEAIVRTMDARLAAVRARIPDRSAPRVMSFESIGYTAGSKTTFDDILRAVGAVNVSAANGIEGIAKINVEKVAEWQPDVIVAGASRSEADAVRRAILAEPAIAASKVGRDGRVIVIDNCRFQSVSHYILDAIEDLADGLYGK